MAGTAWEKNHALRTALRFVFTPAQDVCAQFHGIRGERRALKSFSCRPVFGFLLCDKQEKPGQNR